MLCSHVLHCFTHIVAIICWGRNFFSTEDTFSAPSFRWELMLQGAGGRRLASLSNTELMERLKASWAKKFFTNLNWLVPVDAGGDLLYISVYVYIYIYTYNFAIELLIYVNITSLDASFVTATGNPSRDFLTNMAWS